MTTTSQVRIAPPCFSFIQAKRITRFFLHVDLIYQVASNGKGRKHMRIFVFLPIFHTTQPKLPKKGNVGPKRCVNELKALVNWSIAISN
ncbi:siderophore-interacting protein [Sesbania bispinosa]|nr:siderophore-interacting protein [Sesbania bispinosa]